MNRNQGIIAAAIVFAGMVMRPGVPVGVGRGAPAPNSSPEVQQVQTVPEPVEDGPQKASCSYWKPGETQAGGSNTENRPSPEIKISITETAYSFDSHLAGAVPTTDSSCGTEGWGIPDGHANVTAILATVPDPRTASPWEFDRTIEVLTQAAAEYGFVGSYFWLPWHQLASGRQAAAPSGSSDPASKQGVKLPGLIILKQTDAIPSAGKFEGDTGVLYLFLVGQSPALGVNGEQLQTAVADELTLNNRYHVRLSFKSSDMADSQTALDVIGPENSGAAASLRAALESAALKFANAQTGALKSPGSTGHTQELSFNVAGVTSTIAADQILLDGSRIRYLSFGDDTQTEESLTCKDFQGAAERAAFLTETGTLFGLTEATDPIKQTDSLARTSQATPDKYWEICPGRMVVYFPRNISLLRNTETDDMAANEPATSSAGPYMRLSLRDSDGDDGVPPFSAGPTGHTAFSQEAQWMLIVRQLTRAKVNTVVVSASNSLDALFLVKSLHRDVPDARVIVYDGGDLFFTRIGDDEAYLGTVTVGANPLTSLAPLKPQIATNPPPTMRTSAFADSFTESIFNAASYTFWNGKSMNDLHLAGYRYDPENEQAEPPPLWATTVGRDGYYPLAILSPCASQVGNILPALGMGQNPKRCSGQVISSSAFEDLPSSPAFSWYLLCIAVSAICLFHGILMLMANVWSPLTRDLSIRDNDQPRRRAVYLHIAAATLFSMAAITGIPVLTTYQLLLPEARAILLAAIALLSGLFSAAVTVFKTRGYRTPHCEQQTPGDVPSVTRRQDLQESIRKDTQLYPFFNLVAACAAIFIPLVWWGLCKDMATGSSSGALYTGFFFGYRCLFPASGVCPLLPVMLILITWYVWAMMQTKRLRFSENCRPVLPSVTRSDALRLTYVSDEALGTCAAPTDSCLFENIECLLITRQLIRRRWPDGEQHLDIILLLLYLVLFASFVAFLRVEGLGNFLRLNVYGAGFYELLISALFFPLLAISVSGCIRIISIWTSLSRGLLEPMERSPLRFAFSRMTNVAWTTMLRQGGLYEYWLDLARSVESMQQLVKLETVWSPNACSSASAASLLQDVRRHISLLFVSVAERSATVRLPAAPQTGALDECLHLCLEKANTDQAVVPTPENRNFLLRCDLPCENRRTALNLMCAMEYDCARFADLLLHCVLAPYWLSRRHCFVEAEAPVPSGLEQEIPGKAPECDHGPNGIYLAEEFVVLRYVSLIRTVLINLRLLITFVTLAFVLALLAWNSYPFQPKRWVDWTFTILLIGFGVVVFWVFAQMHRNAILSRITGTKMNELGWDFFLRSAAYGAVPVLTWVASQFPPVSGAISKFLQSGFAPGK